MKPTYFTLIIFLGYLMAGVASATPQRLVVVTGASNGLSSLNVEQVRKIYLGVAGDAGTSRIQPLFNDSTPLLREMFLQKVVFMSNETFQHFATKHAAGETRRLKFYRSEAKLIRDLRIRPNTISVIWETAAERNPGLKVIGVL